MKRLKSRNDSLLWRNFLKTIGILYFHEQNLQENKIFKVQTLKRFVKSRYDSLLWRNFLKTMGRCTFTLHFSLLWLLKTWRFHRKCFLIMYSLLFRHRCPILKPTSNILRTNIPKTHCRMSSKISRQVLFQPKKNRPNVSPVSSNSFSTVPYPRSGILFKSSLIF